MKYLVTSAEMKRYDSNTINKIGIPGLVLMERAALAIFMQIEKFFERERNAERSIMILAGVGNNGGDGLALARLLLDRGYKVGIWCVGKEDKETEQWKQQATILKRYGVNDFSSNIRELEYTILVDALFGVGLSREVTGEYAEAIMFFNQKKGFKVAVDIPSGLDADSGSILGCAVKADMTVTFAFGKRGLFLYPGCEFAGEVIIAEIGITEKSFFGEIPTMYYYDEIAKVMLPARRGDSNKGTFGKVLLIAGSMNMAGAAILAAKAAYRTGAGMVKVITPPENRIVLQTAVPEALLGNIIDLEDALDWADVVVIGPGMGKGEVATESLKCVIEKSSLPLVIDADGLNLLAEDEELQQILADREGGVIVTPHVGELARLVRREISVLKENLPLWGMRLAERLHVVVVAKDARTFVCQDNKPVCVNVRGNSGMATAGSGDVLAGVIAGLLAQRRNTFEAAAEGVYLHALAGECVAKEMGEHAVMAGDIIEKLGCSI